MIKKNDLEGLLEKVDFLDKNVLFLQGPLGNFFKKTIRVMEEEFLVRNCYQLVFNQGDLIYSTKKNRVSYTDTLNKFEVWIEEFYIKNKINYIFLLGDSREYHKRAIKIAKKIGVDIYVFEEGYFRPNYITLERGGVNDNSELSRDIRFYLKQDYDDMLRENNKKIIEIGSTYGYMAKSAIIYYILMYVFNYRFKNYKHHRTRSVFIEAKAGFINYVKKKINVYKEHKNYMLIKKYNKRYFFVPLQVREDFQVREHSDYKSVEHYIEDVLVSFKENGVDKKSYIVIKHHPMDRGKVDYTEFIEQVCFHIKLKKTRVIYVYDINLPEVLKGAKGCITINSTVGLQSLYHGVPLKVMGRASYNMEGLTHQGDLDSFWRKRKKVNKKHFKYYREYIVNKTQISGSFFLG